MVKSWKNSCGKEKRIKYYCNKSISLKSSAQINSAQSSAIYTEESCHKPKKGPMVFWYTWFYDLWLILRQNNMFFSEGRPKAVKHCNETHGSFLWWTIPKSKSFRSCLRSVAPGRRRSDWKTCVASRWWSWYKAAQTSWPARKEGNEQVKRKQVQMDHSVCACSYFFELPGVVWLIN